MVKFIITSSFIISLAVPAAARLNDFKAQVDELVGTSPPAVCERGPGSTMFCNEGEFCKLDKSSTCLSTEFRRFTGTCVASGTIGCPAIFKPVCGCDGVTYSSECDADANQVDIKSLGECEDDKKVPCADATGSCVYVPDSNTTFVGKTVTTSDGILVDNFLGIKYGTFDERFAPSQPLVLNASDGNGSAVLVNATEYGPVCPQPSAAVYDEDCLYLNIFSPSTQNDELLAVMVWIHGGYWVQDAGSNFDGTNLAGSEDVVVVTINYRLGVFGFLPTGPDESGGMNGLLDAVTALEWVKEYIGYFGGDPNRVTVFGESAGGVNTCFLSVLPAANGLFQRAILQSGQCAAFTTAKTQEQSEDQLEGVLQGMNCTSPPCTIEDLESLTTEELLGDPYFSFRLSMDPAVLPAYPVDLYREGKINPTDMIIGANTVDNGDVISYTLAFGDEAFREDWIETYSSFEVLRNPMHSAVDFSVSTSERFDHT